MLFRIIPVFVEWERWIRDRYRVSYNYNKFVEPKISSKWLDIYIKWNIWVRIKISNINIRQSWLLSLHTDTSDETAMLTTRCKKLFDDRVVLSIFKALDCLIPYIVLLKCLFTLEFVVQMVISFIQITQISSH